MSVHISIYIVYDVCIYKIQFVDLVCPKYRALLQKEGRTLPRFPHTPLLNTNSYERTFWPNLDSFDGCLKTNNYDHDRRTVLQVFGSGKAFTVCFACRQKTVHKQWIILDI